VLSDLYLSTGLMDATGLVMVPIIIIALETPADAVAIQVSPRVSGKGVTGRMTAATVVHLGPQLVRAALMISAAREVLLNATVGITADHAVLTLQDAGMWDIDAQDLHGHATTSTALSTEKRTAKNRCATGSQVRKEAARSARVIGFTVLQ